MRDHLVAVFAIVVLVGSLGFSLVALITDVRAFLALANLGLYCWLVLCGACSVGALLTVRARYLGTDIPLHLTVVLVVGIACGLFALGPALRVLDKEEAEPTAPLVGSPLDLRNHVVQDRSFAEQDLRRSQLAGATFRHVDLSGTNLAESDLRNVEFEDVDLSRATLCGVDLRGADLRGAMGLDAVADWSYVFYDHRTQLPATLAYLLFTAPGPIPDTGRDLLYMCSEDVTRRIDA